MESARHSRGRDFCGLVLNLELSTHADVGMGAGGRSTCDPSGDCGDRNQQSLQLDAVHARRQVSSPQELAIDQWAKALRIFLMRCFG